MLDRKEEGVDPQLARLGRIHERLVALRMNECDISFQTEAILNDEDDYDKIGVLVDLLEDSEERDKRCIAMMERVTDLRRKGEAFIRLFKKLDTEEPS